jgi:hypothetical protein
MIVKAALAKRRNGKLREKLTDRVVPPSVKPVDVDILPSLKEGDSYDGC